MKSSFSQSSRCAIRTVSRFLGSKLRRRWGTMQQMGLSFSIWLSFASAESMLVKWFLHLFGVGALEARWLSLHSLDTPRPQGRSESLSQYRTPRGLLQFMCSTMTIPRKTTLRESRVKGGLKADQVLEMAGLPLTVRANRVPCPRTQRKGIMTEKRIPRVNCCFKVPNSWTYRMMKVFPPLLSILSLLCPLSDRLKTAVLSSSGIGILLLLQRRDHPNHSAQALSSRFHFTMGKLTNLPARTVSTVDSLPHKIV